MLQEVVLQGGLVGGELVGLASPGQAPDPTQAAVGELVEVALDAAAEDIGQAGDVLVGQGLALQSQDLYLLLHARVGVVVALVADGVEVFGAEGKAAHGGLPCS